MFYTFNQNNSGGSFDFDEARGLTHYVIVEASSPDEANRKAESIGLYWDGVSEGQDCECCGDRWCAQWSDDSGDEQPDIWGKHPSEHTGTKWMKGGREVCIHYADGRKEWF